MAYEPILAQVLRPKLAVEGLDERVIRWLAKPAEVERDAAGVRPQIQDARDELATLVDADRLHCGTPVQAPLRRPSPES